MRDPDRRDQEAARPVDVLVCNAASNPYYGPNEKLPDDVFMKVMQNNILSNMWLVNLCLPESNLAGMPRPAKRFFRKLLTKQCRVPRVLVTDKLRSYPVAHRAVICRSSTGSRGT